MRRITSNASCWRRSFGLVAPGVSRASPRLCDVPAGPPRTHRRGYEVGVKRRPSVTGAALVLCRRGRRDRKATDDVARCRWCERDRVRPVVAARAAVANPGAASDACNVLLLGARSAPQRQSPGWRRAKAIAASGRGRVPRRCGGRGDGRADSRRSAQRGPAPTSGLGRGRAARRPRPPLVLLRPRLRACSRQRRRLRRCHDSAAGVAGCGSRPPDSPRRRPPGGCGSRRTSTGRRTSSPRPPSGRPSDGRSPAPRSVRSRAQPVATVVPAPGGFAVVF